MRYWDSSALVALHVNQASTRSMRELIAADSQVITWVLSDIEMRSALHRLGLEGAMSGPAVREAITRVSSFWETLNIVSLVAPVKIRAKRLLGVHNLRAADALQLGAALLAVDDDPSGGEFVCLDERLSEAAGREGFSLLP